MPRKRVPARRAPDVSEGLPEYATIMFNLCNEPWLKYYIDFVADKDDLTKSTLTSARLKRGDVLYMESYSYRYELCFIREKVIKADSTTSSQASGSEGSQSSNAGNGETVDVYRFSRCKINFTQSTMLKKGVPLPADVLEVIDNDLDWGSVKWSKNGVSVGGKEYRIVKMLYLSPTGVAPALIR